MKEQKKNNMPETALYKCTFSNPCKNVYQNVFNIFISFIDLISKKDDHFFPFETFEFVLILPKF